MRKWGLLALALFASSILAVFFRYFEPARVWVMNPSGWIADQQRDLIVVATLLMLIVVVPVFILTFYIVFKYKEGNSKAKYQPDWDSNPVIEVVWWGIPIAIISVLGVMTWRSSHDLDPFKPIESSAKPLEVQVVALDWKWLFIYPDQNVATVNYLTIPEDVPVNFTITSDAPMNSFWIPQLGGQIYAMAGMSTKLHLRADEAGRYYGMSSNISGRGFAGMNFETVALKNSDFNKWLEDISTTSNILDKNEYSKLAEPSENLPPYSYGSVETGLYASIVNKYMAHGNPKEHRKDDRHDEYVEDHSNMEGM